jgi:methylmalonyl-CoA mutase
MMPAMEDISFISGFNKTAKDAKREWLTLAAAGSDPAAVESRLGARLYEGLSVKPVYARADSEICSAARAAIASVASGANEAPPWRVIQLVALDAATQNDVGAANSRIKADLANGTHALWLEFGDALKFGQLAALFEGVDLGAPHLYAWGGRSAVAGAALLAALVEERGADPASIRGSAGFDPLSEIAVTGATPLAPEDALASATDAALLLQAKGYALRPFMASGRAWRMAGGSATQELAFTFAAAVSYWRAMEEAGVGIDRAIDSAALCLTADCDLFLTIAKFRAARALWSRALEAAGRPARAPALIAEMSLSIMSASDPHVNMLRATAAAFGAGLGGADACLLLPFNACLGAPDEFSLRMVRNTQLILQEEAHLGQAADAAGGSWYVESLTAQLAEAAWNEFRQIEAQGGLLAAILSGYASESLRTVREARETATAHGRDKLTGVNAFPNLDEAPLPDLPASRLPEPAQGTATPVPPAGRGERFAALIAAARAGAGTQNLLAALEVPTTLEVPSRLTPIAIGLGQRAAEPFELLRRASDKALAEDGARPRVFLANLGKLAEFGAYATWARNFFAAGGVQAVGENGFDDLDSLQAAFQASGAHAACICGREKTLSSLSGAAQALKAAGARDVLLASKPDVAEKLPIEARNAIDRLVYEGCDMLAILSDMIDGGITKP